MAQDIETFCMSCSACAASKDTNSKPRGLLHNLPIPDRPWQSISMGFLGPLPKLNNFDYLLVIIDQLTSQVHLVPITTTVTAKGIAWIVLKEVVRLHRIPESIVSNRDTQFTSIFWKELQKLMKTMLGAYMHHTLNTSLIYFNIYSIHSNFYQNIENYSKIFFLIFLYFYSRLFDCHFIFSALHIV